MTVRNFVCHNFRACSICGEYRWCSTAPEDNITISVEGQEAESLALCWSCLGNMIRPVVNAEGFMRSDMDELGRIVKNLANTYPMGTIGSYCGRDTEGCRFCEAVKQAEDVPVEHLESCLWARARRAMKLPTRPVLIGEKP